MQEKRQYDGYELGEFCARKGRHNLLVRVIRSCLWDQCDICDRDTLGTNSIRPVDHVLRDIDLARDYVTQLADIEKERGHISYSTIQNFHDGAAIHTATDFFENGEKAVFLQDKNSLAVNPDDLHRILLHIKDVFPSVDNITSYNSAETVARVSDEDMARFREAGLNRIHIDIESGSDKVLKNVREGLGKVTQVEAGLKVKRAGMELSEYWMPGVGGKALSKENAVETAEALNRINPDIIQLYPMALPESASILAQDLAGGFEKIGPVETAQEILLMLESLEGITSTISSSHRLNLFVKIEGTLPDDKEAMLTPLRNFLKLAPKEQLLFYVGRRASNMFHLDDLNDPKKRQETEATYEEFGIIGDDINQVNGTTMSWII